MSFKPFKDLQLIFVFFFICDNFQKKGSSLNIYEYELYLCKISLTFLSI